MAGATTGAQGVGMNKLGRPEFQPLSRLCFPRLFLFASSSGVPLNASSSVVTECSAQLGVWTPLGAGDLCLQLLGQRHINLHSDSDRDMGGGRSLEFKENHVGALKRPLPEKPTM